MSAFRHHMRRTPAVAVLALALGLAACSTAEPVDSEDLALANAASDNAADNAMAAGTPATALLLNSDGLPSGKVTLVPVAGQLEGTIEVTGLVPGEHGMHIHAVGDCSAADFTSAGGHLNPDGRKHGLANPDGAHQGDLPQLIVGEDGSARQSFMAPTSMAALYDEDGAAFVVHAGPDDMMTDPSGNSGPRILCGVFGTPG